MGLFDFLDDDKNKKQKKKDPSFTFNWLNEPKDPIKSKKHKPAHKDLESYSCDEEAAEDGWFDENL